MLAETDVGAETEGEVAGAAAIDAEGKGRLEHRLVPIGRWIPEHAGLPGGDGRAAHGAVGSGGAHELAHRRDPADDFVEGAGHVPVGVGTQLGQFVGVFDERQQAAGNGRTGGVVAGGGDDLVVAIGFQVRDRLPVDARVGDHAGHVVRRLGAAAAAEVAEVGLEVPHRIDQRVRLEGALIVGIGGAEQLLGELHHQRLVGLRHPEDRHDHPQRVPDGHVLDEVALAAEAGQPVHVLGGQLVDAALKLAQVLAPEPGLGQHPVAAVLRIVHGHQGADQVPAPE